MQHALPSEEHSATRSIHCRPTPSARLVAGSTDGVLQPRHRYGARPDAARPARRRPLCHSMHPPPACPERSPPCRFDRWLAPAPASLRGEAGYSTPCQAKTTPPLETSAAGPPRTLASLPVRPMACSTTGIATGPGRIQYALPSEDHSATRNIRRRPAPLARLLADPDLRYRDAVTVPRSFALGFAARLFPSFHPRPADVLPPRNLPNPMQGSGTVADAPRSLGIAYRGFDFCTGFSAAHSCQQRRPAAHELPQAGSVDSSTDPGRMPFLNATSFGNLACLALSPRPSPSDRNLPHPSQLL